MDEFHCLTDILAGRIAAIHPVTTVLRLAQIQGRLSFSPRYRTRNRSADRGHFNTSFNLDHSGHRIGERAVHVNRERGRQDMHMDHNSRDEDRRGLYSINNDRHRDEEHREHTKDRHRERPSNRYNRNDHRDRSTKRTSNQRTHGNNITDRSTRTTGTSNCQTLTAATPRHTQQKDGLFISRLSRHTRATDVVSYIRNEANLNLRCDPVPTKYDSYRSYYIHARPQHLVKTRDVAQECHRASIFIKLILVYIWYTTLYTITVSIFIYISLVLVRFTLYFHTSFIFYTASYQV